MTRNLNAFGLTLVAILALGAMATSVASADTFKLEGGAGKMTGTVDPGTVDSLVTTAGTMKCKEVTSTAAISSESESSVEFTPVYKECTIAVVPTAVDMNGCTYLYTLDPAPATTGTMHIVCPTTAGGVTDEIEVTIGISGSGSGTRKCTIDVPEQTIGGVKYVNIGMGATREITIEISTNGLTYKETATGTGVGACAASGLQHGGSFTAKEVITGENAAGTEHRGAFVG